MMEQNKIHKYIFYAFGEILLIVIGILIALQVNNWNENRIQHNKEKRFLERLAIDLDEDLENIKSSLNANNRRVKRAEDLLKTTENPKLIEDDPTYFIQSIEYAGYTSDPVISNHTFEEIKSSGNLTMISNEEVRIAIAKYYDLIYNRNQYNFITQDIQLKYLDYRLGILTTSQQINMGSFRNDEKYTIEDAREVYERMINKKVFIDWLPIVIQSKIRAGEKFQSYYQRAEQLKKLIKSELI
jgi:hypothetical protein